MFKLSLTRQKAQPENNRLYCRCNETPLDVFIDCLVNKNYSRLIREGKPLQKEIDAAWQKLWFEYCDLSDSSEYRQLFGLIKEVGKLEGQLLAIRLALQCISYSESKDCVNILHGYGYKYAFDRTKPDEFQADLQRTQSKSKTLELLIQSTRAQIDRINDKSKGTSQDYQKYFDECLISITQYMHVNFLRPSEITVAEFVRMRKRVELEAERIQNRANGK